MRWSSENSYKSFWLGDNFNLVMLSGENICPFSLKEPERSYRDNFIRRLFSVSFNRVVVLKLHLPGKVGLDED